MKIQKINLIKNILMPGLLLALLSGCAVKQVARHEEGLAIIPAKKPVSEFVRSDIVYAIDAYDPWEGFNRNMYVFNYYFDKYVFLPVVDAYEWIMPDYAEDRISGIFKNIGELRNFTNNLLQLKGKKTAITTGRFLVNSTIGLAGMYDPAAKWAMPVQKEDFGQTLGYYSVGAGPYLVLPIIGPSTLRDTTGFVVDTAVHRAVLDCALDDVNNKSKVQAGISLLMSIDARHRTAFRYYQSGSPFEYDLVRMLYLEKRKMDIAK
ncbi:MlaA family lipoprotein [Desulfosarcina sp. BuS5]|uniref:MlaA family lipoprotein n=1 Tax=Desulfosarcina sp. BuS5 TaxID=933262 RepID=UPI000A01CB92|nr:VacJ family lipoprotein [Desulfosarcina sp. BuS5]